MTLYCLAFACVMSQASKPAGPVLVETKRSKLVYTYLTYEHTLDETMRAPGVAPAPCRFRIRLPFGVAKPEALAKPAPLVVSLHARGGSYKRTTSSWPDHIILIPDDNVSAVGHTFWFGYHNQFPARPDRNAEVVPYTVNRLVYCVRFVCRTFNVDRSAVWAAGQSMGGAGALTLAMMHPELVAGAWSNLAPVEARRSPAMQQMAAAIWGPFDLQLKVAGADVSVWQHQSLAWQLSQAGPRVGWLQIEAGKADPVVPFEQYAVAVDPPAVNVFAAFGRARAAGSMVWDQRGHGRKDPWGGWYPRFQPLAGRMIRLDRSFPAFANASTGPMAPAERGGPWIGHMDPAIHDRGMVNPFFRWDADHIVDRPERYEIRLWLDDACPVPSIDADVTIRNVRRLAASPGARLSWEISPPNRSGIITVGQDGLPTVAGVPIPRGPANAATLSLSCTVAAPIDKAQDHQDTKDTKKTGNPMGRGLLGEDGSLSAW